MTPEKVGGFRLYESASLYLRGHASQPVEWWPWTPAAIVHARQTGRKLFVSSGFMACHWCHVMAREAFSDSTIAVLLNEHFVCIKIDREERPDIDQMLLTAAQDLGVRPGWPLNVILTPGGSPVWAGTYFAMVAEGSQPGFAGIIESLIRAGQPEPLRRPSFHQPILSPVSNTHVLPTQRDIRQAANILFQQLDPELGGRRGSPKFFDAALHRFLWRIGGRAGRHSWRGMVSLMLRQISSSATHDHVGGGFFRYATGPGWSRPHFEKMLSDNAQILELLSLAHADNPDNHLAPVAEELVAWLDREMLVPVGAQGAAYGSAQSSETEGKEGAFHLWDGAELTRLLGNEVVAFQKAFNLSQEAGLPWREIHPSDPDGVGQWDAQIAVLRDAQGRRMQPARDSKILGDWNLLLVCALARAAFAFNKAEWLSRAEQVFQSLVETMSIEGRISHAWQDGQVLSAGLLEDQALFARAAIMLGQATGRPDYIEQARKAAQVALDLFVDTNGRCRLTPLDANDLPTPVAARVRDDAMPAGPGLLAEACADLEGLTRNPYWRSAAARIISVYCNDEPSLWAMPSLLAAADALQNRITVTVKRGSAVDDDVESLDVLGNAALASSELSLTLLRETQAGIREQAFICFGQACYPPSYDVNSLINDIKSISTNK